MPTDSDRLKAYQAAGALPGPSSSGGSASEDAGRLAVYRSAGLGVGGTEDTQEGGSVDSSPVSGAQEPDAESSTRLALYRSGGALGEPLAEHAEIGPASSWPGLPDARLTPGVLTKRTDPDYDGDWFPSKVPHSMRNVSLEEKARVAARYGIPLNEWNQYEFDHFLPLSAGGANSEQNLFPQPKPWSDEKDKVEWQTYDDLKAGRITQDQAIARIRAWRPSDPTMAGRVTTPDGMNHFLGEVRPGEGYQEANGVVGHGLEALSYPGNAWRSFLKGMVVGGQDVHPDGEGSLETGGVLHQLKSGLLYGKQALTKDRQTSEEDLKSTYAGAYGLGDGKMGTYDGRLHWGNLADFGVDLGVGVLTDPLMAVTEGVGKLAGDGGVLARGAAEAKAGLATPEAASYTRMMAYGRAGVGGALGVGAADKDDPWYGKLASGAAGALAGAAGPAAVKFAATEGRAALDVASDAYAVATRGPEFAKLSQAVKDAGFGQERVADISRWIVNGRNAAMKGLASPEERDEFTGVMHDLKNSTVAYREQMMAGIEKGSDEWDGQWNRVTAEANDHVANEVMPRVLQERFGDDPEKLARMQDAVNLMADHNTNVTARLNNEVILKTLPGQAARELGDVLTGKTELGLPGLRFHVDDVHQVAYQSSATAALERAEAQIHSARLGETATAGAEAGLTPDQTYAIYAERTARLFLTQTERDAGDLVRAYGQSEASNPVLKTWENYALRPFDAATNFMKGSMLYFSTSWLRTQFWDNMSKAYTEGGFGNFAQTAWDATGGAFTEMGRDLRAILKGDSGHVLTDPDLIEAMQHGVIHDGLYQAMRNDLVSDFVSAPRKLADEKAAASFIGPREAPGTGEKIAAAFDWIGDKYKAGASKLLAGNPVVNLVQSVGSYMEGAARMSTYLRARDAMVAGGVAKDVAMKAAADLVERTFFNYSNVTMFEKAVARRLMPFYTFYSKNMPYWMQAVFDPARVGRVAALDRVRQQMGTTPTARDVAGMTPYLADNAPRKIGKDEHGNTHYVISPVDPRVEALKMVDPYHIMDTLQERGNSLIKTPYELASGHDLFTDDALYPSGSKKGRKYLFSRGFKWTGLQSAGEMAGLPAGWAGVGVDPRGNPYATSDKTVAVDKALQALLPMGAIEQFAGRAGKDVHGRESVATSALNMLQPYQEVSVSPGLQRMARKRNAEKMKGGE